MKYRIVHIKTYKETLSYLNSAPRLNCFNFYNQRKYDEITNYGMNRVFFCMSDDYDTIHLQNKNNMTKEEYNRFRNSAICVITDIAGNYIISAKRTDRFTHYLPYSKSEIEEILGVNFLDTFPGNMDWINEIKNIKIKLKAGIKPEDIFEYVCSCDKIYKIVWLHGMGNLYNCYLRELEFEQWFRYTTGFKDLDIITSPYIEWNSMHNNPRFDKRYDYITHKLKNGLIYYKEKNNWYSYDKFRNKREPIIPSLICNEDFSIPQRQNMLIKEDEPSAISITEFLDKQSLGYEVCSCYFPRKESEKFVIFKNDMCTAYRTKHGCNIIFKDNKKLFEKDIRNIEVIGIYRDRYLICRLRNKNYKIFSTEKNCLICEEEFKNVEYLPSGIFKVYNKDNKCKLLYTDGEFLTSSWYDKLEIKFSGEIVGTLNGLIQNLGLFRNKKEKEITTTIKYID